MLIKNRKRAVYRGALSLVFVFALSALAALSPLVRAEESPKYTWKDVTVPGDDEFREAIISPDGSKLFILREDTNTGDIKLLISADNGVSWNSFAMPDSANRLLVNTNGSKMIVNGRRGEKSFYMSTDGGHNWMKSNNIDPSNNHLFMSPDGSFLVSCSGSGGATGYTTNISTDDGQTWTQKGTVTTVMSCPRYVSNNGSMIIQNYGDLARSTDYGQTWTETPDVLNDNVIASFSNNGNNIFDGDKISLDGGNHWTPSNAPIPAGYTVYQTGISDDGKKLFVTTRSATGAATSRITRLLTSVDGGRTWHSENGNSDYDMMAMSSDGSKLFYMYDSIYRVGTLPTPQPVTPGAGAGGVATPSASTSATPGQKPGKA